MPLNASHVTEPGTPVVYLSRIPGQMSSSSSAVPYSFHGERSGHLPWTPLPLPVAFPFPPVAMGQMSAYPSLDPVPRLLLVPLRPPGPGPRHQPPFQDGSVHTFDNFASLAPIQLAERSPVVEAVSVAPTSGNHVVLVLREIEHQSIRASDPTRRPSGIGLETRECNTPPGWFEGRFENMFVGFVPFLYQEG